MGTQNPTIASTLAQKRGTNTSQVKESQRPSKKQQPGTMMTKTKTMALCACLAAMLLASPALANRNLLGEMDDAMDAMNATMDAMNMTANAQYVFNQDRSRVLGGTGDNGYQSIETLYFPRTPFGSFSVDIGDAPLFYVDSL